MHRRTLKELFELARGAFEVRQVVKRIAKATARPGPKTTIQSKSKDVTMNLQFLTGYKTYVVAVAMLVAAVSQLLGVDLPSFDGQSAGHLLMEGLAILFLRKSLKAA